MEIKFSQNSSTCGETTPGHKSSKLANKKSFSKRLLHSINMVTSMLKVTVGVPKVIQIELMVIFYVLSERDNDFVFCNGMDAMNSIKIPLNCTKDARSSN